MPVRTLDFVSECLTVSMSKALAFLALLFLHRKMKRDRAIEKVVGDVELVEDEFVQVRDWVGELVVFEKQSFLAGEAIEGGGKGPEEVVETHVQANQVCQIK